MVTRIEDILYRKKEKPQLEIRRSFGKTEIDEKMFVG
jgi:hypothetical protein